MIVFRATQRFSDFGKIFGSKLQITYSCAEETCLSSYPVKHGLPETHLLLPLLPSTQSLGDALVAYMGQKADRKCKTCGAINGTDQRAFEVLPPYLVLALNRVDVSILATLCSICCMSVES